MVIPVSCDIGFLCSNMQIEANEASYDMELKNHNLETQGKHANIAMISDFCVQTCESKRFHKRFGSCFS